MPNIRLFRNSRTLGSSEKKSFVGDPLQGRAEYIERNFMHQLSTRVAEESNNRGALITLSRCMPPRGVGKIASLYQFIGVSSSQLFDDLSSDRFWGAESLIGQSIIRGQRVSAHASESPSWLDIGECKIKCVRGHSRQMAMIEDEGEKHDQSQIKKRVLQRHNHSEYVAG
jgi:hypothetical protein